MVQEEIYDVIRISSLMHDTQRPITIAHIEPSAQVSQIRGPEGPQVLTYHVTEAEMFYEITI